jgi:hypothetical protein
LTPGDGIAGVIRTNIAIVTVQRWSTHTDSGSTGIRRGTGIAVITRCRVVGIDATTHSIAGIIRTDVAIITV